MGNRSSSSSSEIAYLLLKQREVDHSGSMPKPTPLRDLQIIIETDVYAAGEDIMSMTANRLSAVIQGFYMCCSCQMPPGCVVNFHISVSNSIATCIDTLQILTLCYINDIKGIKDVKENQAYICINISAPINDSM